MARIIDSFPVDARGPQFRGDPQWFNGQVWELDAEHDLEGYKNIQVARMSLVQYGRFRGLKVRTAILTDKGLLILQATKEPSTNSQLGR